MEVGIGRGRGEESPAVEVDEEWLLVTVFRGRSGVVQPDELARFGIDDDVGRLDAGFRVEAGGDGLGAAEALERSVLVDYDDRR